MPKGVDAATGRGTRFKDRTGTRNGRLLFLRVLKIDSHRHNVWEAACDCGKITATATPHKTRSCGCLHREVAALTQVAKTLPAEERLRRLDDNRRRQRARRKTDPVIAMQARLSRLHRHALRQVGAIKTSPTFEQLGYTPAEFVKHIERQFPIGMGWRNMDRWQVDHVLPVSMAKSEADVIALNQLSNLRPMWSHENNRKKDRRVVLL
jgi:hypothetical protein